MNRSRNRGLRPARRWPLAGAGARARLLVLVLLACWQFRTVAAAAGNGSGAVPWQVTADSLVHFDQPEYMIARGDVVMTREQEGGAEPLVIKADWVRYDVGQGRVSARGHVFLESPEQQVTADEADLDLNNQTGTLRNAVIFLAENHLYISGREVEKTGEFTYRFEDGWASSCTPQTDKRQPWRIRSADADVTLEGAAVLKHARLQVKDVPVLYTPYLVFPAKTKRETGFLFPEWSQSSRDGFGLMVPFFINLSPSADITLYPGYLQNRGVEYDAEFRYVAAGDSYGTFMVNYLRDRKQDTAEENFKSDGEPFRTDRNRYWVRGKADHDFGDNLLGKLDIDLVSDHDYLQEFEGGLTGFTRSDEYFLRTFNRGFQEATITDRESTMQLTKSWADMTLFGEVQIVQDSSDLVRATSPLQRLPRIEFDGRRQIGRERSLLSLAWDTEYVYYWRDEGVGAHRLDLHPRLITSIPRGSIFEGRVTAGLRETVYDVEVHGDPASNTWQYDNFQNRTVPDFEGNLATLFMRDFDISLGPVEWLEHSVRPNLVYNYIPQVDESELPNLDSVDRINPRNWLTYELNNYFDVGGTRDDGTFFNHYAGYFKILQTYDIREDRRALTAAGDKQRVLSDLRFDLDLYPTESLRLRYQTNLSVYGQGITRYELLTRYADSRGDSLAVDYRYLRDQNMSAPYFYSSAAAESVHEIEITTHALLTETLSARYEINKSFSTDHTVRSSLGLIYQPNCWMVEIEASRSTDDQRIMVIFSLEGIGRALRFGRDI